MNSELLYYIKTSILIRSKKSNIKDNCLIGHIYSIVKILDIALPTIKRMSVLFDHENQIDVLNSFKGSLIPTDATPINGFYNPDCNIVFIAESRPYYDFFDRSYEKVDFTEAELVFIIAHELRHVWQYSYHPEKYYKKNAVGNEVNNDIAEIDADAFALAYTLSLSSSYSNEDIPNMAKDLQLQAYLDGGARIKKALEYSSEYCFESEEKIMNFIKSADYITLAKRSFLMGLLKPHQ